MEKIFINLSKSSLKSLHPILKNLYKKLETTYKIEYINGKIIKNNTQKEIPKIQKNKGLEKIKYFILKLINNFIPRLNIIKKIYNGKILTANNFLITRNDYFIITSSLIQFSGLKVRPLYNFIFKLLFKKLLLQKKLKKIYFYSKTALKEFEYYSIKELGIKEKYLKNKFDIIYPYLRNEKVISKEEFNEKFNNINKTKFLFIARNFLGKGGLELINALEIINKNYKNIINKFEITIISDIPQKYKHKLKKLKKDGFYINLYGINFTQDELENKFYKTHHVLLHLTRADLFGMVSLESKKNGLAVITTKQYLNYLELFKNNEALFVDIKEDFNWNNGLPKIDYIKIWNIEKNILNINNIVNNIVLFIKNKKLLKEMSFNNLQSLENFKNNDKKYEKYYN